MDEKDRQIIKILKDDGRAGYGDIGNQVGLSEGAVKETNQDINRRKCH